MSTVAERMLTELREAGKAGLDVETLPKLLDTTKSGVTRAIRKLESEGQILHDGDRVRAVLRIGRRLISTVERDEIVLKAVRAVGPDGSSLVDLVKTTGYTRSKVYQSVWRLARQGKVYRSGMTRTARWTAVPEGADTKAA